MYLRGNVVHVYVQHEHYTSTLTIDHCCSVLMVSATDSPVIHKWIITTASTNDHVWIGLQVTVRSGRSRGGVYVWCAFWMSKFACIYRWLTMSWSREKPMPTQPVVMACKVNVMVSPLTEYATWYSPFDEDLLPKHTSASTSTKHVLDQCVHVYQMSPSMYLVMYPMISYLNGCINAIRLIEGQG